MINFIVELLLSVRFWFWKVIVGARGGRIERGTRIFERVKIFSSKKSPVFIGEGCTLQTGVIIASAEQGSIVMEPNVYLGEYTVISSRGKIRIGENSIIATNCFVVDFNHRFEDADVPIHLAGYDISSVDIGKDCWIGAGCQVLKGVKIGEGAVIGAGSVVTRDIPAYSIAVGAPCRVIGQRERKHVGK
jgi:serine acetyltransferase